jgi:hypothetical protein
MNIAIVTARAGSKSIIDNSILPLRGKPIVHYPILAARAARTPLTFERTGQKLWLIAEQFRGSACACPKPLSR